MAFDYVGMQATATDLIAEFGKSATMTRTAYVYNPATGASTPTVTTQAMTVVTLEYSLRDVNGDSIRQGDLKAFISVSGAVLVEGDRLTFDGETWAITIIKPLKPASIVVMYEANLRRGGT